MSHGHHHDHEHDHPHDHHHEAGGELRPALDVSVPDGELPPDELGRRNFLRSAGLLGAGGVALGAFGVSGSTAAVAAERTAARRVPRGGYQWLAGDHHIHTQYSPDAQYRVIDHVRHADAFGLDWMVITDHGSLQHAKIGVEKVNPDIVAARKEVDDTLVFQGLEWNIPAAEHGTVFVHPGRNEVSVLKAFENGYDGVVNSTTGNTTANEQQALAGLHFLAGAVEARTVSWAMRTRGSTSGSTRTRSGCSPGECGGRARPAAAARAGRRRAGARPRRPVLVTRDFVRPRWAGGQLVLHAQPARGGTLVPFETPSPTPCCADHA